MTGIVTYDLLRYGSSSRGGDLYGLAVREDDAITGFAWVHTSPALVDYPFMVQKTDIFPVHNISMNSRQNSEATVAEDILAVYAYSKIAEKGFNIRVSDFLLGTTTDDLKSFALGIGETTKDFEGKTSPFRLLSVEAAIELAKYLTNMKYLSSYPNGIQNSRIIDANAMLWAKQQRQRILDSPDMTIECLKVALDGDFANPDIETIEIALFFSKAYEDFCDEFDDHRFEIKDLADELLKALNANASDLIAPRDLQFVI